MLILYGLLSRQIVGKVCTCYLSLCSIFLSHNILFLAPGLVLPLFHFKFLLLDLSSIARGTCLLHLLLLLLLLLLLTAKEMSLGGNGPYTSYQLPDTSYQLPVGTKRLPRTVAVHCNSLSCRATGFKVNLPAI